MSDSEDDMPLSALKKTSERKRKRVGDDDEDFVSSKVSKSHKHKKEKKHKKDKKHKKHKKSKKEKKHKRDKYVKAEEGYSSSKKVKKEPKSTKTRGPTIKELHPLKKLEMAMKAHKWWEAEKLPEGMKWKSLEHNGVMFPPAYEPHGVKLVYDGKEIDMTPEQEEVATLYAAVPLDGPQLGDAKVAKVFNKNFFTDFKKLFPRNGVVKKFDLLDFSKLRAHVLAEREARKGLTKEQKEAKKAIEDEKKMKYTFAFVDGNIQKIGNVMVEPPGLFRGRGAHPKTGTLKKRVMPEQITLNIGEDAPIPKCPVPGHRWGGIVHKHDVTWLATWKENVMDNTKYVWLAASSGFKGQADMEKYEKARRLKKFIPKIRRDYEGNLNSRTKQKKQIATAMWVIDRLALRVGGEKDEDEADTVGCCSLRVEHVAVDLETHTLTLDFLGKDSMRHHQTYKLQEQYGDVGLKILKNFDDFCKKKKKGTDVFDQLDPNVLNDHLKTLMPGLSAKVFRTYNASSTLEEQLEDLNHDLPDKMKVVSYNAANRQVAILCNHQRTVSKSAEASLEKLGGLIESLEKQLKELKSMRRKRKRGENIRLKDPDLTDKEEKKLQSHLWLKQPSVDQVGKRIETWKRKIESQKLTLKNKDDNKTVALGTSKINYCDPRITVAWAKRNECPIEKVFPGALRDKFPWAMSETTGFKF